MIEIRWHGRGGQGAKTVALLFADAALSAGKYIQAFPEYGPERMGAPVQSFNRLSDKPILVHCQVSSPKIVAVLDPTLIGKIDVTAGLPENGILIVNTPEDPKNLRKKLKLNSGKIYTVDATTISKETMGREMPNTPMLAAVVKISRLIDFQSLLKDAREKLEAKFRNRPEVVVGNIKSMERAYEEVKGEVN
ncbi:MAG: 2-oxoacid:acceptor oxidoreductase family protein [Candidatus Edwardsbacteria bacterium]